MPSSVTENKRKGVMLLLLPLWVNTPQSGRYSNADRSGRWVKAAVADCGDIRLVENPFFSRMTHSWSDEDNQAETYRLLFVTSRRHVFYDTCCEGY